MVSIIVPVYNCESYLRQCLSSIKQQSLTDIEVICVDDGSTDKSNEIIKEYALGDKRFKYIYKKHSNAGEARNVGMAASRGDYLIFLDGDDFFAPNMIENALKCSLNTDADITVFQYKLFYENLNRVSTKKYGIHTNRKHPFSLFDCSNRKFEFTNIAVWNKLYKADFIKNNHLMFKSHIAINDLFFSWSSLILAKKIALCQHVGVFYRVNSGKSTSDNLSRISECFFDAFQEINEYTQAIGVWEQIKKDLIVAEQKQLIEFYSKLSKDKNLHSEAFLFKKKMLDFLNF